MPLYLEYYFWLVAVSAVFFALERIRPWRPKQKVIRDGLVQDLFWLVFNQQYVGWVIALGAYHLLVAIDAAFIGMGIPGLSELKLVSGWPLYAQVIVAFIIKDFIEWNVHRMLHIVPWMWNFHKLHHSIENLDWLAAFRTHWGDILIHRVVGFIPLILLGVDPVGILIISIVALVGQEVSHSNLKWDFGILRYVLISPRFHVWHHDVKMYGKGGQNFAVNLAIWDWIFGTWYWPDSKEQPDKLGFQGMNRYPQSVLGRLLYPIIKFKK